MRRLVHMKLIEYFPVYTIKKATKEKTLLSLMLRMKSKHVKFREISAREIELSGINVTEFNDFLERHGAHEVFNYGEQLENL